MNTGGDSKITNMESQSNEEGEEQNTTGRELDSSNDDAVCRDSSNDDGVTFTDDEPHASNRGHSNQQSSVSESQNSLEESMVSDEAALMLMSTEEQQYYDQYLKANPDRTSSLKCTTCSCQLFLASPEQLRIHPALGVLICKNCRDFYSKGPFTKDNTGHDEYCRWCAEGGIVICCDTCSNVFCKACLRRCIGRAALSELSNSDKNWSCLLCNNERIWAQRAQCRLAFSMVHKQSRNRRSALSRSDSGASIASTSDDPAVWLPVMLNQAEKLATQFKLLLAKVGTAWNKKGPKNDSESTNTVDSNPTEEEKEKIKNCCRKLRKAIVTNRFNMKVLEKKLVTKYTRKYKSATDIEIDVAPASGQQNEDSSPHGERLVMKIKNFREGKRRNSYYAEIDGQKSTDATISQISADSSNSTSTVPMNRSASNSIDTTLQVAERPKTPAINSFDAHFEDIATQHQQENSLESIVKKERTTPEPQGITDITISMLDSHEQNGTSNSGRASDPGVSKLKFNSSPNLEELRKDLLKDSSEESDVFNTSESSNIRSRVKHTKKPNRPVTSDLKNDPKLKAGCAVILNRLENAKLGEIIERNRGSSDDAAIDRKINRLLRSDSSSSKYLVSDSDDSQSDSAKNFPKKNSAKISKGAEIKAFRLSDLGSSSETSDLETLFVAQTTRYPMSTAVKPSVDCEEDLRQALLESSSSDTEPMSDLMEEKESPKVVVKTEILPECGLPKSLDDDVSVPSNDIKVERNEENPDDHKGRNIKERDRSLSPETAKLLHDPIAMGNKKSNEEDDAPGDRRKSREKRKRRIVDSDSDFQSSGSGKEEKQKTKRKKPKSSDDDFEEDDEETSDSKPKRRRRIKKVASSDSEASDDSDIQVLNESQRSDPGSGSKGRKNIKKIMKDQNLKDETKAAAKEEEERKKRIAERQKMYNENFVGDIALESAKIDKLVLDFDPKTKKELVTVDERLVTKLKPHQVKGVKFMWDACFESIERIKEHPGSGCILAHCMGLGKSLQIVTLSHTVLKNEDCQVKCVLVVCPLSTVLNWLNEFNVWLPDSSVSVYELASAKTNELRVSTLQRWMKTGGVMIIGYDMYRNLSNEQNKRIKAHAKARETFQRSLVDPGPQLVVCDEGHLLKNETTALSKAMNRIATKRRIVLTGTPLQNSLLEYHCMIQFVKPNLLGTKKEFTNRFANPIKNGQAADSTDGDVRVMKRRAHVLHKMLEDSVQRFDYSVLTPFLPPKHEYVVSVRMSDIQIKMYQYYLEKHAKGVPGFVGKGKGAGLFADFQELGRVWTHPRALMLAQLRRELKACGQSDTDGSMAEFIDDRETPTTEDEGGVVCLDDSDEIASDAGEVITRKPRTRASRGDQPAPDDELGVTVPMSGAWWSQFVTEDDMKIMEHSGKLVLLMDILRQCELIGDKVLVFSQSLVSLDLIEEFLQAEDERNEKNRASLGCDSSSEKVDHIGSWVLNVDYFRLDGQTSPELRKNWCNTFNRASNTRARLFLISTKAGGLGINLVAANRVILFDASWNPSHDVQSIFRVYRFGQKKPCYIYRFLAQGTMEEKIYDRQVTKLSLSCRVVDEQQIERHFNSADLNELYVFEPDSHLRRPTPLLPKDRLLAELTIQRKEWIVTYHEHDSLLENKAEEELTEAERKAAWEDFENEKRGYSQFGSSTSVDPLGVSHFGIPGMAEVFASLAGRSVAGIPLSNIAAMIYNSNPGISQDEFLGRLRLTVDQLQNFSVQQVTAPAPAPPVQPSLVQQPGDAQRLIMQRQVAQDQLKRQFGNSVQPPAVAGPSGLSAANPLLPARSRGRPTIGPHQRTDLYGLGPVIAASAQQTNPGAPPTGKSAPPKT